MNNDILISVIIPAFNVGKCLAGTLESVLSQTHGNLEIIVVNDGSKDNTGDVIDAYAKKDSRIVAIHKENGGVTRARLDGVRKANGAFIGFVDGDDLLDADMYERLLKNALENNADISHCGYKRVSDSGETLFYGTGKLKIQDHTEGLADLMEGAFIEPTLCNKLFKRELFDKLITEDLMDYSVKNTEDLLMNYYLFKEASTSVFEDFCAYHYIFREGSTCNSAIGDKDVIDPSKVREIILNDLEGGSERLVRIASTALLRMYISEYTLIVEKNAAEYKEYLPVYRKKIRENKKYVRYLNKGGKIHAKVIMYFPLLCKPLFSLYYKG